MVDEQSDPGAIDAKSGVASVAKTISILRLLGSARFPLTMTEIARDTGLTTSSCHDLVSTLVQIGFVQPSTVGKCYELGARLVRLAKSSMTPKGDFSEIQRRMNLMADKYDVNVSLFRPFGQKSYISTQVSEGSAPIRIRVSAGQVFPLFHGAAGLCFAARLDPQPSNFKAALEDVGIRTKSDVKRFRTEIEAASKRGWAVDRGRAQPGVGAVAVLCGVASGASIAVLELGSFKSQFNQAPLDAIVADAKLLAEEIAAGFAAAG